MTPTEKAQRAKDLLKDPVILEILETMEERALNDFLAAHRWWWGDRRRRLAAEQLREVREFRRRLDMAGHSGPNESIKLRTIYGSGTASPRGPRN